MIMLVVVPMYQGVAVTGTGKGIGKSKHVPKPPPKPSSTAMLTQQEIEESIMLPATTKARARAMLQPPPPKVESAIMKPELDGDHYEKHTGGAAVVSSQEIGQQPKRFKRQLPYRTEPCNSASSKGYDDDNVQVTHEGKEFSGNEKFEKTMPEEMAEYESDNDPSNNVGDTADKGSGMPEDEDEEEDEEEEEEEGQEQKPKKTGWPQRMPIARMLLSKTFVSDAEDEENQQDETQPHPWVKKRYRGCRGGKGVQLKKLAAKRSDAPFSAFGPKSPQSPPPQHILSKARPVGKVPCGAADGVGVSSV
jgi:hypothetical protein